MLILRMNITWNKKEIFLNEIIYQLKKASIIIDRGIYSEKLYSCAKNKYT